MKEIILSIPVRIFNYEELDKADRQLIDEAREATRRSYSPYSRFAVGAAARLLDGTIVSGSNQENAASPSGHRASAPNEPPCFTPTPATPTNPLTRWPLPHATNGMNSSPTPFRPAVPAGK